MGENNDSFLDRILLKNIGKEISNVNLIEIAAKNSPPTTRTNSLSAQTKKSKLLQNLKNQISLKSDITFLREELKENNCVVRTLLNMKCKFIDDCISTMIGFLLNLLSAKSPRKNRTEISDTPAENTPEETIIKPKNAVHGSYNSNNLGKDNSSIDITRTNPKKIQKYNAANSA